MRERKLVKKKKTEEKKSFLDVLLMKKPNKKAQEWFEEHEFELMNIKEYDHWINVVNAEKVTNAQLITWKSRANKALNACLNSKKGSDALANEISDFICNLEENKDCLVVKEVEEKLKKLELKAKYLL